MQWREYLHIMSTVKQTRKRFSIEFLLGFLSFRRGHRLQNSAAT